MSRPSPIPARPTHTSPRPGPSLMCLNLFKPRPGLGPNIYIYIYIYIYISCIYIYIYIYIYFIVKVMGVRMGARIWNFFRTYIHEHKVYVNFTSYIYIYIYISSFLSLLGKIPADIPAQDRAGWRRFVDARCSSGSLSGFHL